MIRKLFAKKKIKQIQYSDTTKLKVSEFSYHPKIILAWAKAIEGDSKFLEFLNTNNFKELVMATYAIQLKEAARNWLMENGYPHVMAMINAAEGNEKALKWLEMNNFEVFYHMAKAIDHENESFKWLNKHASQDIYILTKSIQKVKDLIEANHNDIHLKGKDF